MKTLYLAWQTPLPKKAWFPIGRLDADSKRRHFLFGYTKGAEFARKQAGMQPLDSFPDFHQIYKADELFTLFRNRVVSPDREDFLEYLDQLSLSPEHQDPMEILAITGGERQTDSLEVFPKIEKQRDACFRCRFFVHGYRHTNPHARARLEQLRAGDKLQVSVELNNPATGLALQLSTPDDYHMIGWTPRYLVDDLIRVMEKPTDVAATVVKVNLAPAPAKLRVLVQLEGQWPKGYEPMSSPQFQPIRSKLFSSWR